MIGIGTPRSQSRIGMSISLFFCSQSPLRAGRSTDDGSFLIHDELSAEFLEAEDRGT